MGTHERIIHAALALLEEGGRRAVTTRAVSEAAGVQAPAIYRGFGDMEGLLAAAATLRFTDYLVSKRNRPRVEDPVDDLRQGWNLHVEFGLAHPAVYSLMYGDSVRGVAAVTEADAILRGLVQRVAEAGRLRVSVELAAQVIHAAGMGVTLALIETPPEERQPAVSETTREAVLRAVITDGSASAPQDREVGPRAVALKAVLGQAERILTPAERQMLSEWLDRLAVPAARVGSHERT